MAGKKSVATRAKVVLDEARQAAKQSSNWVEFHNAVFGLSGVASREFPEKAERTTFGTTDEFKQIMAMMEELDDDDDLPTQKMADASGTIVVRGPKSLHAALIAEAEAEGVSLNQLCVSKLATQLVAIV